MFHCLPIPAAPLGKSLPYVNLEAPEDSDPRVCRALPIKTISGVLSESLSFPYISSLLLWSPALFSWSLPPPPPTLSHTTPFSAPHPPISFAPPASSVAPPIYLVDSSISLIPAFLSSTHPSGHSFLSSLYVSCSICSIIIIVVYSRQ